MNLTSKRCMLCLLGVSTAIALLVVAACWCSRGSQIQRLLDRAEGVRATARDIRRLVPLVSRGPVTDATRDRLTRALLPLLKAQDEAKRNAARDALVRTWQLNGVDREVKRRVVEASVQRMEIMIEPSGASEYTTDNVTVTPSTKVLFRFAFSLAGLPDGAALSIRGPLTLNGREIMIIPSDGSAWFDGGGMESGSYDLSSHLREAGHYVLRWTTSDSQALGGAWRQRVKEPLYPQDLLGRPLRSNEIGITVAEK